MKVQYDKLPYDNVKVPIRINYNTVLNDENKRTLPIKWHEQLEILHFERGGAVVEIAEDRFTAQDGDIFIINPLQTHQVYYASGQPQYDCLMIDRFIYRKVLAEFCRASKNQAAVSMDKYEVSFQNVIRGNKEISSLLNVIIDEFRNKEFAWEITLENYIQNLMTHLFRRAWRSFCLIKEQKQIIYGHQKLEPVLRYLEQNYMKRIHIDELASLCFVTPKYFCRIFKKTMGQTVMSYIDDIRFSKAEWLLRTTDLSISEIALQVGFEDSAYFSRRFKQVYSVSPREFR